MKLYIERLEITNFKGIQSAVYEFTDETNIFGRNGTGKSSIVDAFMWLLFNKDALGNAPDPDKFSPKPLDDEGREIHYLDTTVTAYCKLDGAPFVLKRTQRENWVTKRGTKDAVFQGNGSTYWINEVETKESEFTERIGRIASDNVFRLITTLGAFNAMKKDERRTVLLAMSGTDVDAELLQREEYAAIAAEIRSLGIGVDDLRKVLNDRKTKIGKELQLIPARIDEARRMRPAFTDQEIADAEYNLRDAQSDLEKCQKMLAQLETGDGSADDIQRQILSLETDLIAEKRRIADDFDAKRRELRQAIQAAEADFNSRQTNQRMAAKLAAAAKIKASESAQGLVDLRNRYKAEYDTPYQPPKVDDVCTFCGQPIPEAQRDRMFAEARKAFDDARTKRLTEITQQGKELKARDAALHAESDEAAEALRQADEALTEASKNLKNAREALEAHPASPDYETERIKGLESEIYALRTKRNAEPDERAKNIRGRIADLEAMIERARAIIAKKEAAQRVDERVAELEAEQEKMGQRRADAEVMIYTVEQFVRDRCGLLEESINSHFPTVRWKLFNIQNNGGIKDCCECMIPGEKSLVSYSGTNTAAKVNADIEIIGVLSRYYDVIAPVFVDNAERINYIVKPAGQLITLSVSDDPTLRIEQNHRKEAA